MSEECIVAVFDNVEHAQEAIHILDRGDFPTGQISLVTKGPIEQPEIAEDLHLQDDSDHDAAVGAGLGAIVGVLSGLAVMVASGMGPVFLIGPVGGGLVGSTVGAFLGAIAGWGVHHDRIRHYEQLVQQGRVLVIAHGPPLLLVRADRMLMETDPIELHMYTKTSPKSQEPETAVT